MEEMYKLLTKAKKAKNSYISLTLEKGDEWSLTKEGPGDEDVSNGTYAECIAKLKEWATPPKPETITITVPYHHAVSYSQSQWHPQLRETCLQALKPYEVQP